MGPCCAGLWNRIHRMKVLIMRRYGHDDIAEPLDTGDLEIPKDDKSEAEVEQHTCPIEQAELSDAIADCETKTRLVAGHDDKSKSRVKIRVTRCRDLVPFYNTCKVQKEIFTRIYVWKGDITKLEIDCIVNAANAKLSGGGGVNGAIHRAAGYTELQTECQKFEGCRTGRTVSTGACRMNHVKRILHTVGPKISSNQPSDKDRSRLISCYRTSLQLAIQEGLRSVAFPCISTGIFGYPFDEATSEVCKFVVEFFAEKHNQLSIDKVVFAVFSSNDLKKYDSELMKIAQRFNEAAGEKKFTKTTGKDERLK